MTILNALDAPDGQPSPERSTTHSTKGQPVMSLTDVVASAKYKGTQGSDTISGKLVSLCFSVSVAVLNNTLLLINNQLLAVFNLLLHFHIVICEFPKPSPLTSSISN